MANNDLNNITNNLPATDHCDDQPNFLTGSQPQPDSAPTVDSIDTASLPSPAPVSKAPVIDLAALRAKAEAEANGNDIWNPVEGDIAIGEVSLHDVETKFGPKQLLLLDNNGEIIKLWFNRWLQIEFEKKKVSEGDFIAVFYKGIIKKSKAYCVTKA